MHCFCPFIATVYLAYETVKACISSVTRRVFFKFIPFPGMMLICSIVNVVVVLNIPRLVPTISLFAHFVGIRRDVQEGDSAGTAHHQKNVQ